MATAARLALRPFSAVPGPAWPGLPLVGNITLMRRGPFGSDNQIQNLKHLRAKLDVDNVGLLRLHSRLVNPDGAGRICVVFEPGDVEAVFRAEGAMPVRGQGLILAPVRQWKLTRRDLFPQTMGLLLEDGPVWKDTRAVIAKDMLAPAQIAKYESSLGVIAAEMVAHLEREKAMSVDDLFPYLLKFGLETIMCVALDTRLGVFDSNIPEDATRLIDATLEAFETLADVQLGLPLWKVAPRLSKKYMKMEDNFNIMADYIASEITACRGRIAAAGPSAEPKSILERLVVRCGESSSVPFSVVFDLCSGAIDTTAKLASFFFYYLAVNPDKQDALRRELRNAVNTKQGLYPGRLAYFRACLRETSRLNPVPIMTARVLPDDLELRGFLIPAHTLMFLPTDTTAADLDHKDEFLPERWLRASGSSCPLHHFSVNPFGHGPRGCLGRRLVELNLALLANEILHRYELSWTGASALGPKWRIVTGPDQPLKFQFRRL